MWVYFGLLDIKLELDFLKSLIILFYLFYLQILDVIYQFLLFQLINLDYLQCLSLQAIKRHQFIRNGQSLHPLNNLFELCKPRAQNLHMTGMEVPILMNGY